MPAINLARLRLQAYELAGLIDDPAAFQAFLHSLLDEHSHRLLRRGRSMARRGALPAWDVPGILIRELEAALLPAAQKKNERVLETASAVWISGKLEEKQLAAYLAGLSRKPGEVRALLLRWLEETDDPAVLQDLGAFLDRLAPDDRRLYCHTTEGADDMPAHIRTALTQTHLSIPIHEGRLALGTWQGIYLCEHRKAPHQRNLVLHLAGE